MSIKTDISHKSVFSINRSKKNVDLSQAVNEKWKLAAEYQELTAAHREILATASRGGSVS